MLSTLLLHLCKKVFGGITIIDLSVQEQSTKVKRGYVICSENYRLHPFLVNNVGSTHR